MNFLLGGHWGTVVQGLLYVCILTYAYYILRTKIPLIPTQAAARQVVMNVIRTEIEARPGQKIKIYDLGSGMGGLCMGIARAFPNAEVVGLEMAWPPWLFSFLRQKLLWQKNLRFLYRNFWKYDVSDGDIVVFYLGYVVMQQMSDKLRKDARPGRLVVSNTFAMPKDWVPLQRIPIAAWLSKEILVYRQTI